MPLQALLLLWLALYNLALTWKRFKRFGLLGALLWG